MHQILVSNEVKNKLLELCLIDGKSEDYVLRELLSCSKDNDQSTKDDFVDATYGIHFTKGFMIFRTYKGERYSARVYKGCWVLDGIKKKRGFFYSLNQLSRAVVEGNENAWKFWYFISPKGEIQCISELRDPDLVKRYQRPKYPRKSINKTKKDSTKTYSDVSRSIAHHSIQTKNNQKQLLTTRPKRDLITLKVKKPWERD